MGYKKWRSFPPRARGSLEAHFSSPRAFAVPNLTAMDHTWFCLRGGFVRGENKSQTSSLSPASRMTFLQSCAVRHLSLLLVLFSPTSSFTFSNSVAFHPRTSQLPSSPRRSFHPEVGTYREISFGPQKQTRKQRFVSAITFRLSAPSTDSKEDSLSKNARENAISSMQNLFPTAPKQEIRRFLNKQKGDAEKASRMYEKYLEWCETHLPVGCQWPCCGDEGASIGTQELK